jgi:hypothetical protein
MAASLSTASLICYIVAAVLLILSVVLFIALNIPQVFNDYTGRTAKKKIMNIRDTNENAAKKTSRTDKKKAMSAARATKKRISKRSGEMPETGLLGGNQVKKAFEEETTGLLGDTESLPEETDVIVQQRKPKIKLTMIDSVMMIHTDEVIT